MTKINPSVMHDHGWSLLRSDAWNDVYYRWIGDIRHELHVIRDDMGRVKAWTHWQNRRIAAPDQDLGRKKRLLAEVKQWGQD